MDKRVVFAVAGSGKTARLINELDLVKRVLLITYTECNCEEIRRRVLVKFGHLPDNITVCTYFTFLNSFCYRPLLLMAATSRNKLYVACSRARGDLYVMPDTLLKAFKKARDVRHVASA